MKGRYGSTATWVWLAVGMVNLFRYGFKLLLTWQFWVYMIPGIVVGVLVSVVLYGLMTLVSKFLTSTKKPASAAQYLKLPILIFNLVVLASAALFCFDQIYRWFP